MPAEAALSADAKAVACIQARVRGNQDRRRAMAKRLTAMRVVDGDAATTKSSLLARLDIDVEDWLESHESVAASQALADIMRVDFQIDTLRDLIVAVQDPADWTMLIQDEPDRCHRLWIALQKEVKQAAAAVAAPATSTAAGPAEEEEGRAVPLWFECLRCASP